jgi:hypothetical protein
MAITPSDAKKITKEELEQVNKLEEETDKKLLKGMRTFTFKFSSDKMRVEFLKRYESAGWKIVGHFDQWDGDYWSFSEPINRFKEGW